MDPSRMIHKLLKNWQSCEVFLRTFGARLSLSKVMLLLLFLLFSHPILSYYIEIVPITLEKLERKPMQYGSTSRIERTLAVYIG